MLRRPPRPVPISLVTTLTGAGLATLVVTRPPFGAEMWARGDDVALAVAWAIAVATSAWLLVATGACALALRLRRPAVARRIAPTLPLGIRRLVEVAIVAACVAVPAMPAGAAPTATTATGPTVVLADVPVVRAPAAPAPTVVPAPGPTPASAAAPLTAPAGARVVVRPGDNLWLIARTSLTRASTRRPTEAEIMRYWHAVIAANRSTLRSGDPSVIFPGEVVTVPPVRAVS